jgi:hypothetical protein
VVVTRVVESKSLWRYNNIPCEIEAKPTSFMFLVWLQVRLLMIKLPNLHLLGWTSIELGCWGAKNICSKQNLQNLR